jgi:hypothetical protein
VGHWQALKEADAWWNPTIQEGGEEFITEVGHTYRVQSDDEGVWAWSEIFGGRYIRILNQHGRPAWVIESAGQWVAAPAPLSTTATTD